MDWDNKIKILTVALLFAIPEGHCIYSTAMYKHFFIITFGILKCTDNKKRCNENIFDYNVLSLLKTSAEYSGSCFTEFAIKFLEHTLKLKIEKKSFIEMCT